MFTGLIEAVGRVVAVRPVGGGSRLAIESDTRLQSLQMGESIAVDGVCLTVVKRERDRRFEVDVSAESMAVSTLGVTRPGARVNLERALQLGDRLGGHLVSGHVDSSGELTSRTQVDRSWKLTFKLEQGACQLLVPKGSVSINGVSLTINGLGSDHFDVNVIPHTGVETNLLGLQVGDKVNIEVDMLSKMVQRQLAPYLGEDAVQPKSDISLDLLGHSGFIKPPLRGRGGGNRSSS